jgi:protein-S-isoprenylcysteine O-methyltransferase Ste14
VQARRTLSNAQQIEVAPSALANDGMDDSPTKTLTPRLPNWGAYLFPFLYLLLPLLCLRQWGTNRPWSRLDIFSGSFLALSAFLMLKQIQFKKSILQSREVLREASGTNYDPSTVKWGSLQSLAELAVLLDYAHWHLVPSLEKPVLQEVGLGLSVLSIVWLLWADAILVKHFDRGLDNRELITHGPFRLVRHPRYVGLLGLKAGFALAFASVLGWISLAVAVALVRRRIQLEENHLRGVFGQTYESYMRRTARMFPGFY